MTIAQPNLLSAVNAAHSNPPPSGQEPESELKWSCGDSAITDEDRAVAVYPNRKGGVLNRQEAGEFQDEDPTVFFSTPKAALKVAFETLREFGDAE